MALPHAQLLRVIAVGESALPQLGHDAPSA